MWEIKPVNAFIDLPPGELLIKISSPPKVDYLTDGYVLSSGDKDPKTGNIIFYKEKPLLEKTIDLLWDPSVKQFMTFNKCCS